MAGIYLSEKDAEADRARLDRRLNVAALLLSSGRYSIESAVAEAAALIAANEAFDAKGV